MGDHAYLPFLASACKNAGPTARPTVARCRLQSLQKKILKEPEWEMDCVTRPLDGNMLNPLPENDLWK
jgi:hypothetical protein